MSEHSLCLVPALLNTALVFQKLNNIEAELEARILFLKVYDNCSLIVNNKLLLH